MVNISSFGRILKAEGLGIKSIARTIYKDKQGASYLVNLKNGSTAIYDVSKEAGQLQQTLKTSDKAVNYFTKKSPSLNGIEVYTKSAGYVEIPQTQSLAYVRNQGKITAASNYKRTPVSTKTYVDPATGQFRTRVNTVQELHADKYVSHGVLPTDILIDSSGVRRPIFERPMTMGEPSVTKIWQM